MKQFFYKIIFPPFWIVIAFILLTIIGMIMAISSGMANTILNYVIYGVSFYGLCIAVAFFIKNSKGKFKNLKTRVYKTKYGNRYFTDIDFKTNVTLYINLILNVGNILLNIVYGLIFDTNWFFILAFYYATLTLLRVLLSNFTRKNHIGKNIIGEWQRARVCAAVLTLINISLSGVVLMMMYRNKGFTYAGMLIYVMAAYTFYHITVAIVELIKYRKYKSPIVNSLKMVRLAAALVSMLSLETAMLSSFGSEMPDLNKKIFIAATGAGICLIVLGLSSYMIVKSTKEINKIKEKINE
jgi:hypothetical protein